MLGKYFYSLLICFAERKTKLQSLFALELLKLYQMVLKFVQPLVNRILVLLYFLIMMLNLV